jgi:CubicO group peptidase (beta-lactamase class C family)
MPIWIGALLTWLLLAPVTAMAETELDCARPAELPDGWPVAAPEDQGLDPVAICAIGPRFEAWKEANVHAVVVIRHGVLVYERYFAGEDERWGRPLGRVAYDARMRHDLRSITKSVTALLVGIAVDRSWLEDLDAPVLSFFPEYADLRTPEKDRITVRHLLTMSAGLAWNEELPYSDPENSERQMTDAPDPYRYVLAQPSAAPPGQVYNYNGGATAMLAAILRKLSGRSLDVLAKEALFEPLGIRDVEWVRYANGDPIAASGLRLRPRDLAKIGQLVLDRGVWQGRRIVSPSWIEQSTSPQIQAEEPLFYGYQWWLGRSAIDGQEIEWAAGFGWGGQRLFVVPDRDLVVVVMAGLYANPPLQRVVAGTVLTDHVLPAAASR